MPQRVVLLSPPFIKDFMRNARCDYVSLSHTQWYPIWLAYSAGLLEKYGHTIMLLDAPAERLSKKQTCERIIAFRPDIVAIYTSTKSKYYDIALAEEIKQLTGAKIVFVGPFVSCEPTGIIEQSLVIDYVIKGEFEYPLLEIANGIEPSNIRNLIFRENGKINNNPIRPPLKTKELDSLPFVTDVYWRHLDVKRYKVPSELYPFVDLFTGRGCFWGRCTFCLWVWSFIPGSVYNTRSIENVIEELKFVSEQMKDIKEIFIQDDSLPKGRISELSKAILDSGLKITWGCYVRGNIDIETLELMKKAGCRTLHVGYESADAKILENVDKGITKQTMTEFTENVHKLKIRIHGDFLVGLPGETEDSIRENIKWAKQLNPETVQFSIMNPYPCTPFYDYLIVNGYLEDGEPNYPNLSNEQLRKWSKKAVREYYIRWRFLRRMVLEPGDFLIRLDQIMAIIPRIFWMRW